MSPEGQISCPPFVVTNFFCIGGSRYTEEDVLKNSTERVMSAQGLNASPQRPANTGMSHSDSSEFVGAGAQEGIQIWRIEDLRPVPVPRESYGKFYSGDSYILLHTKIVKNRKEFIIHFWLGSESTIDETGKRCSLSLHRSCSL